MEGKERLRLFLKFLREKLGFEFDKDIFDDRLKLQKYIFIARFLGFSHDYTFNRYLRGPYSPGLAKDYYTLPELEDISFYMRDLGNFNAEKFQDIVGKKSPRWLEIAATILSVWNDYRRAMRGEELKTRVIETVNDIKSLATREKISEIFTELEKNQVLEV